MAIPPLDVGSLSLLIARELGQRLAWPLVRRITTIAEGNAFLAVELARVASAPDADADELSPAALSRASHVRRLAETRVRVLPEPTRTALAVVAALGEPRGPVLSRVLEDEAALDAAFDTRVIEEQGARVRFSIRCSPPPPSRASRRGSEDQCIWHWRSVLAIPEERARHLAAGTAEPSTATATAIEEGAADALSRGAPSEAAQLFEEAGRLTPAGDRAKLGERLRAAGDCREQAGDAARALELFRRAVLESPPGPQRARIRAWAAFHEHVPIEDGVAELHIALEESGSDSAARGECLLGIGMALMVAGDWRAARARLQEALQLTQELDDLALRIAVLSTAGHLNEMLDPGSGLAALETSARLAAGRLVPTAGLCPETLLAAAHSWADDVDVSRGMLLAVRERTMAAGDEQGIAAVDHWLIELEVRAGNLERARAYADEAVAILDVDRTDQNLGAALYGRALVGAHEGDAELARRLVARGLEIHETFGDRIFQTQHRGVIGFLELSLDRPSEALEHLIQVDADLRAMGVEEPGAFRTAAISSKRSSDRGAQSKRGASTRGWPPWSQARSSAPLMCLATRRGAPRRGRGRS